MRTFVLVTIIASAFANPKYPDICGLENKPPVESKIVGGQEAARNQFPWLASVATSGACTGSILDENWIMTAKHCVNVNGKAWVAVGIHDISANADEPHKQNRVSSEIHVSPAGDFALIKLDSPLELNKYVRPACLPTRADANETFVGEFTTLTGWGVNNFDKANYPQLYYGKNVKIVKCGHGKDIICTDANPGTAICFGDSGGPLNYEIEDGKYKQIGINQFVTSGHCAGGINGYARLTSHLDFIQETTGIVIE